MSTRTASAGRLAGADWATAALRALADAALSRCARRRIRLVQWLLAGLVYLGSGLVMHFGGVEPAQLATWSVFVALALATAFIALRSGWSERLSEPAMTQWQILIGVVAVNWGYLICGPVRTLALFPLFLMFAFGAFSLHWRRIVALTGIALASLALTMAWLDAHPELRRDAPGTSYRLLDQSNFLMALILLPALSAIAARLSTLRSRLRSQKHALQDALAQVQRLATVDELTGLPNRRAMMERLAGAQVVATQAGSGFCVVLVDLDDFKLVNDQLGHARGHEGPRAVAPVALHAMGNLGVVARWGGEEFLVLLGDASGVDPRRVVAQIQQGASLLQGASGPLRLSAGIARYDDRESVLDTVARADEAMYAAKRGGGNALRIAEPRLFDAPAAQFSTA